MSQNKHSSRQFIALILITSLISQLGFAGSPLQPTPEIKRGLIQKELIRVGMIRDQGGSLDVAAQQMALNLQAAGIEVSDISDFVQKQMSEKNFEKFKRALKNLNPEFVHRHSAAELAAILSEGLRQMDTNKFNETGLAWAGCAPSIAVGVLAVVAVIIMAVIATGYGKSVEAIRQDYDSRLAERTSRYNYDRSSIKNHANQDQVQINLDESRKTEHSTQISLNQQIIAKADGKTSGYTEAISQAKTVNPDGTVNQAGVDLVKDLSEKIKALTREKEIANRDITYHNEQILLLGQHQEMLRQDMKIWSDPEYQKQQEETLTTQYQNDVASIKQQESHDLVRVPEYHDTAGKLWIASGIVGGIGLLGFLDASGALGGASCQQN